MAKGKGSIKGWITKNGVHIPIYGEYTVRGGVEPKAKGSKFKRKKRPEEFDKDIRKTESGKFMAQYSSDQGRKKGVKDIEKPFDTKEEARAFLAKENGEYEDAKFNKKAESGQEKDKKEHNVLGQEVDFAEVDRTAKEREKDFIVNTKIPDDPKSIAKAEKQRIAREAADEADAYDREHGEGKYHDKMTTPYKDLNDKQKSFVKELAEDRAGHKLSDEGVQFYQDLENDERSIRQAQIKERESKQLREIPKGQASSTPDFSKMSYSEAGKYVSEHKKDFGLKPGDDAYQAAYEMKQGTWKQPKEEKKTISSTESYPGTKSFGSSEPNASEYGKAMESIGKRYDSENRTVPGKEMGKVFEGLKPGDQIQVHNKYSVSPDRYIVNDDGTIDYSTPSSSFLGKKGMSLAEAQKHATNSVDNRITVMRRKTEEGSSEETTGSFKSSSPLRKRTKVKLDKPVSPQEKLSQQVKDSQPLIKGFRKQGQKGTVAMPTTVSGLRSAYADATGSMKSKIANELRRKGYSLVGGKWVKGNKS